MTDGMISTNLNLEDETEWLCAHIEELLKKYLGKYFVIKNRKVHFACDTVFKARKKQKRNLEIIFL